MRPVPHRAANYGGERWSGVIENEEQALMALKVRKAVFPAAGLGTRSLPATKAQPKEMLPFIDKPGIPYGAEEAAHSGCDQIIMVTRRGKSTIEDHFADAGRQAGVPQSDGGVRPQAQRSWR